MRILVREVGNPRIFWESKEMKKEEILESLKIVLKPSMFGNKHFDVILKNS